MTLRCPECRSRRASYNTLVAHVKASGHKLCHCLGYKYPHRPGSPYCDHNRMAPANRAAREGVEGQDLLDIALECVLHNRGRPYRGPCPF